MVFQSFPLRFFYLSILIFTFSVPIVEDFKKYIEENPSLNTLEVGEILFSFLLFIFNEQ